MVGQQRQSTEGCYGLWMILLVSVKWPDTAVGLLAYTETVTNVCK